MECLAVAKLPEGPVWIDEINLDGYRAVAVLFPENGNRLMGNIRTSLKL
jgi:hypothetical protein